MKTAIFITVRNGSTRLPNKALLDIQGMSTIEYLIKRVKYSNQATHIILCTTKKKEDNSLVEIAEKNGILCFRGSEQDKLERWNGAAKKYGVEFFVTVDGDDTFCEPFLMDLAIEQYKRNKSDFIQDSGLITGSFCYGIKVKALNKVCEIKDTSDTEMMWVYFTDTDLFKVEALEGVPNNYYRKDIRMTLDYKEDLEFFRAVAKRALVSNGYLTLESIIKIIDKEPSIKEINFFRHEQWANNQKNKTKLKLKSTYNEKPE